MKTITIDDNQAILDLMRFILNKIDPNGTHYFACSAEKGFEIDSEGVRIVFLDIDRHYLYHRSYRVCPCRS